MNEKTEFSYTVTLSQPVRRTTGSDFIAFDVCKAYQLPDKKVLVRNPRNGRSSVVTRRVFSALTLCENFRTLDDHSRHLQNSDPAMQGQDEEIKRVLRTTLNDGLMVSAAEICDLITPAGRTKNAKEEAAANSAVVVIITWERPEPLQRLLESVLENGDPQNFHALYVVDDSRKPENISKNQEIVNDFRDKSPIHTIYFGQQQQQQLLKKIIKKVPQHEQAVRFLADQSRWTDYWTSGLTRNYALLLSVGKRLVVLDDDTICEVYELLERGNGVTLSNRPREADFYLDNLQWDGFRLRADSDPIKAHLECLGLSLSAALGKLGVRQLEPSGLANASMYEIGRLHAASPVLLTQCGTLGDPGTYNNNWLAKLRGASRRRMLESTDMVDNAIRNDSLWLGRKRPHFSTVANMSQITGLDNRHVLPPYFPILRGEDRLFGNMLNDLFPDAAVLDYPWAIPHLPMPVRSRSSEKTDFGIKANFPQFFFEWVILHKDHYLATNIDGRMAHLAQMFIDLGSSSHQQLAEIYRDERTQRACDRLLQLQEGLAEAQDAPENWVDYLQKGVGKLDADLAASFKNLPVKGNHAGVEGKELTALWCGFWRGYGEALRAWQEIRRVASEVVDEMF